MQITLDDLCTLGPKLKTVTNSIWYNRHKKSLYFNSQAEKGMQIYISALCGKQKAQESLLFFSVFLIFIVALWEVIFIFLLHWFFDVFHRKYGVLRYNPDS